MKINRWEVTTKPSTTISIPNGEQHHGNMTTKTTRFLLFALLVFLSQLHATPDSLTRFITRQGAVLYDGIKPWRFISFNIPNLHLLEDDFAFQSTNNWSLPTTFEIRDALRSVQLAGGTVIRIYCLRVQKNNEPTLPPKYITALKTYDENSFVVLDTVLALAHAYGIRLIIPFLEGPPWWGSKHDFARLRGSCRSFESAQIRQDYKHLVATVLNRRNTVTNTRYKDEKAILCWETGNEMPTSASWLREMSAFIKSIDTNHLLMDGNYGVREAACRDQYVDIVSNHFYKKGAGGITRDLRRVAGRKAYTVGEWGWTYQKAQEIISRTTNSAAAGACIWSLRYRYRTGGFTWHKGEGIHWPGGFTREEMHNEASICKLLRTSAYAIRGKLPPPLPPPNPPHLLPITNVATISWQGSSGALRYRIERAAEPDGPWWVVGDSLDETVIAYRPLFCDTAITLGMAYYYRVIGFNGSGSSAPSNIVGPVTAKNHAMVDEFSHTPSRYSGSAGIAFTSDKPERFKYDFHRLEGKPGSHIEYTIQGMISEVRLYTYFPKKASPFSVATAQNDAPWQNITLTAQSYPYCCANKRDHLWLPVEYRAKLSATTGNRLRITFPREKAQLGRCEIYFK